MQVRTQVDELLADANAPVLAAIVALTPDDHVPVGPALTAFVEVEQAPRFGADGRSRPAWRRAGPVCPGEPASGEPGPPDHAQQNSNGASSAGRP